MKKAVIGIVLVILLVLIYNGGAAKVTEIQPEPIAELELPEEEEEEQEEPEIMEEEPSHDGEMISRLTGEWVAIEKGTRRPLAVMLSNVEIACPQTGISNADIIYEAPVEGAITRLMALFEDYDELEKIGSVRSARNYYVYYAAEHDAVYAHFGQAVFAEPLLKTSNIDNLSGLEGVGNTVYYRTSDRKAPHNAYASAEGIARGIEEKGYRSTYEDEEGRGVFRFAEADRVLESGTDAVSIVPGYQINKPYFTYEESEGVYYRYQYGGAQIDDGNNVHLSYKNIIIQYTASSMYNEQYLNLNVSSSGAGQYITNGKAVPVTWRRESEWGKTTYYDENGEELTLNPGRTWICIIQESKSDNVEIS